MLTTMAALVFEQSLKDGATETPCIGLDSDEGVRHNSQGFKVLNKAERSKGLALFLGSRREGIAAQEQVSLLSPSSRIAIPMIQILCKSFLYGRFSIRISPAPKWYLFHLQSPSLFDHNKCFSSNANQYPFAVSYYMNKCGFSLESALSASKNFHFDSPDNPDAVLALLKSHGFSDRHISRVIKRTPQLLMSNTGNTLLPKLEFFYSKGATKCHVARICSGYSSVLNRSLENVIIPSFEFYCKLLGSDEKVIKAFSRHPGIVLPKSRKFAASKIDALRKIGVPDSNVASLFSQQPSCIMWSPTRFNDIVQKVKSMGLNPLRLSFVFAVFVMGMSSETWGRKIEAYRKWGFSEEEILIAFSKFPQFMSVSEDKIAAAMNVFVNQLGLEPAVIARSPAVVALSLRKRIVPRAFVAQALASKGFLKKNFGISTFFFKTEKLFLEKYVIPYKGECSQLLKLYEEKFKAA